MDDEKKTICNSILKRLSTSNRKTNAEQKYEQIAGDKMGRDRN